MPPSETCPEDVPLTNYRHQHADHSQTPASSRRRFLTSAGIGACAFAAGTGIAGAVGRSQDGNLLPIQDGTGGCGATTSTSSVDAGPGRFSRLFQPMELSRSDMADQTEALAELGRPGGLLDANDPLEVGPIRLITEPELSPNNRDNPSHTAGITFIGQFLDHDLTRDSGSTLGQPLNVSRSTNLRTARFDLDSVYGGGPSESPFLYDEDGQRFVVESGGQFEDLPRDANGTAIVADPRNDENLVISALQAAFLLFHNAVLERVEASGRTGSDAFNETTKLVRWHYQWLILHEVLPHYVGQPMINNVLHNGRRFYTTDTATIPVEFQAAAYRFGHSMVRPSYRANLAGDNGEPFFAFIFDGDQVGQPDPDDLSGGHRAPRRFIDWQTFFDFDDGEVKPNKRIDTSISSPLFRLPTATIDSARAETFGPTSLATRNLLRHLTWQLPSGQSIAAQMGVDRLAREDLVDIGSFGANLDVDTPLWLYILREADITADGLHLGPVGGTIVAEVFIGLLELDPTSYLSADPNWRPSLPSRAGDGGFTIVDMLTIAGVSPDQRS